MSLPDLLTALAPSLPPSSAVRPYRPWVRVQDMLGACLTVDGATAGSGAALARCGAEASDSDGQQFLITTATGTDGDGTSYYTS